MAPRTILGLFVFITFFVYNGYCLQCWHCSSELEPSCRDPFNYTNHIGGGRVYDSFNDRNDYDRNRQYGQSYDGQYNSQYNSQYNNQYNRPYDQYNSQRSFQSPGQQFSGRQYPQLVSCNDYDASLKRMKNVCYKRKQTSASGYVAIIRRCEMIPLDSSVGTCYDPVQRGITVDFCEYCDYDGCNSAHNVKVSLMSTLLPAILMFLVYFCKN